MIYRSLTVALEPKASPEPEAVEATGLTLGDRLLARLIRHARLDLYPDAGPGFLFQDAGRFVAELRWLLGEEDLGRVSSGPAS